MAKVSLRPRQYKRLGRLAAKNPERAERVAGRMVERDTRKERGEDYIKEYGKALTPPMPKLKSTMKKGGTLSKAQKGKTVSKKAAPMRTFTKADYLRKDSIPSEMFPGTMIPRSAMQEVRRPGAEPKKSVPKKKMKSGGSFGMLSVKAGIDKNPKPTAADRIAGAKMKVGKMKKGGKMTKKCKYGCK